MAKRHHGQDAMLRLTEDHQRVLHMLDRAKDDVLLFDEIRLELTAHAQVEEELFYPAVHDALPEPERVLVVAAVEDHADVKDALAVLSRLPRDGADFVEGLEQLRDSVLQHVEEEEDELFPRVREVMDAAALAELGDRIDARERELKDELAHA